eukprot:gene17030-23322_t
MPRAPWPPKFADAESLRSACKGRVLTDMLGSINDNTGGGWKVLILDELTTRLLSSSMKMSDILEANVSMVEDLTKERQPLQLVAVYFIQPTPASIARLIADFEGPGTAGPYPSVHIFFSSKAGSDAINRIKGCPKLLKVLRGLKESNMELMGDQAETEARGSYNELDSIAIRLSTFFATINENPAIRYKTGRAPQATDPPGSMARSTLTQRLAQKLYERNSKLQQDGTLPPKTTCDMIILDRSYDPVAPIIHEFETEMANGKTEEREMILDESDEVWRELRHMFIAEVYSAIGTRFKEFQSKNKAAKGKSKVQSELSKEFEYTNKADKGKFVMAVVKFVHGYMKLNSSIIWGIHIWVVADVYIAIGNYFKELQSKNKAMKGTGAKGEMSTGNMKQLIQALPQFREILSRLSLHIQISSDIKSVTNKRLLPDSDIKSVTNERHLADVGEMEQDLVFKEKNGKIPSDIKSVTNERHLTDVGEMEQDLISSDIKSVTNERHLPDVGEMEQDLVFKEKNGKISSDIKSVTNERHLTDVGEMEQELVFRDKNSKDLVSFIAEHIDSLDKVDRMRLFMSYVGCHPEKMDETKRDQWMKLAKLAPQDMGAICNLNYLGVQVMKLPEKSDGKGFFGGSKKDAKATIRTKREDDSGFALYRFDPLVKNIISDMPAGKLSVKDYPYYEPQTTAHLQ